MGSTARVLALSLGVLVLGFVYAASVYPQLAGAAGNMADQMCNPVQPVCGCMQVMKNGKCVGGPNMFMCPCFDITSGFKTAGICMAQMKCLGKDTGGMMPMLPMIPMMMPMMDMPSDPCMQGAPGGWANGTTSTSTSQNSPCGFGGFDSGFGGNIFDTSSYFNDTSGNVFDTVNTKTGGATNVTPAAPTAVEDTAAGTEFAATTTSKLSGTIKIGNAGAQVVANLKSGLTEVAGFFGGSTFNGLLSNSIGGRLCATRPWTGSAISKIIPASFFDGLCKFTGFQVGVSTPTAQPVVSTPKKSTPPTKPPSLVPSVTGTPEVTIWAEPPSVRLGTRTYIFWNAKNVTACTVEGPNFFHNTLSGGASTVPLSGATTYTISCTGGDGVKVTDSVTVSLAI